LDQQRRIAPGFQRNLAALAIEQHELSFAGNGVATTTILGWPP
jgi:hypothetical protein